MVTLLNQNLNSFGKKGSTIELTWPENKQFLPEIKWERHFK